jgi:hypothetical protein
MQGAPVLCGPAPGDDPGDPPFQGREALVAGWERARCDQHRSQMNEGAARRQHVERLVSNHAAGGDGLEGAADPGFLQPVQHEVGTVNADEGLAQPVQLRCGGAARRGEDLLQFPVQAAAGALRGR